MKNKLIVVGMFVTSVAISGCANHNDVEDQLTELTNKLDNVSKDMNSSNAKLNQISADIKDVKLQSQQATDEAQRANERLDNLAAGYKK